LSKGKGLELLVIGRLGGLTGVEYEGTKYQILWLLEDKQRDFKIEQGRIQRKKPLSVRKIQTKHYFVFSGDADDTFSPSLPKRSSAFQEMRKGAGEAYGEKWDSDPVLRWVPRISEVVLISNSSAGNRTKTLEASFMQKKWQFTYQIDRTDQIVSSFKYALLYATTIVSLKDIL
jgi:hypothetical protein